jgi:hypothetical protein
VWLQLAVNSYIVRYTARTEQVMSRKVLEGERQWVHLMVIVEKKAKSEEVWVIFLARRGSEEETGSTQHSIGERRS